MKLILLLISASVMLGCGVKGKPLPPLQPGPLGDGRILYQKDPINKPSPSKVKTKPPDEEDAPKDPRD